MSADGVPLRCLCGRTFEVTAEAAAAGVLCPGCGRPVSPPFPSSGPASEPSLEKILLERGWISQDQIRAAVEKTREEERQGRKVRLGQALLQTGAITPDQLREALAAQGKTPMRCPSCGKLYNVKGYGAGTRALCRACGLALVPPGPLGAAPVEDGNEAALRRVPVGDAIDPALADLIPGCRLERRLGSGGMGDVFLARQLSLDRLVAVKLLPPEMGRDPEYVRRFLSEARAAAKVMHENLVAAVDAGESGGRYYFIMEYVEGEPLHQILRREGPLPERRALEIARDVARGLSHAYASGLIHRDIKPSNIMILLDGAAKICDFGLARETGPGTAIQTGRVLSTPAYASPEQCRGEPNLDHRTDMYSLGVMLFEMLVGRPPFQADTPGDLFAKHVTANPPSPRTLNPQISPAVDQLVLTLLSKPRVARFATYDELLQAIENALAPRPAAVPSRRIEILEARRKETYVKWGIMGAAVIAGLLVLRFLVSLIPSGTPSGTAAGKATPSAVEIALREMRQMEESARGNPNEYPVILERWKELERQYRDTSHHSLIAGPMVQFVDRMNGEANRTAEIYLQEANVLVEANRHPEALRSLRGYPTGFAGTEASRRVIARIHEVDTRMHERYQAAKEAIFTYIGSEKFREAQRELSALKAFVSFQGPDGELQYVRPEYPGEIEALGKKIEEEYVLARRRREEARAKENQPGPKEPQPPPTEVKPPVPEPPPAEAKNPPPPVPVPPATPPGPAKLPEPDAAAQKKAQQVIHELFREEYAKKTPSDRLALARKLIETAGQTKDDPTSRYVLYREAQDLAMLAGDFELALGAIDEIARSYAVNGPALKNALLSGAARNARTPEEIKGLAAIYLRQGEDALALDDFEEADRMIQQAAALARKAKDAALAGRAEARVKEIAETKPRFDRAKKAREALAANPEDGAAHLALGQYLCLCKGDWTSGLLHLARCSDPATKTAASKDLANPSEAPQQVEVGDAWHDLGERETGQARQALRKRACGWYERAVLNLAGLTKLKVEKRIADIRAGK